ncbi:MAG: class I SAM-dependent methyltransferase family protein [Candidatus Aenigmatarchaeota archaeon]
MRSFDLIGSKEKAVAIVEIKEGDEKALAEEIMKRNKNVKSVLKKVSGRKGELRLREYKLIAGDANTEVIHKEYGYLLKLDPQKVYFSPREATERQRIAKQVKAGERVLVMFSGIGVIPIAIAKKQPEVEKIYGIELNEDAHKYAEENVRINKLSHKIFLIHGDVREVAKKYFGKFDRVVMPLPFGAGNFLDIAINCLKKEGGIIHFYSVEDEGSKVLNEIESFVKKIGKKIKVLNIKKVSAYAPRKWKVCIDFQVS